MGCEFCALPRPRSKPLRRTGAYALSRWAVHFIKFRSWPPVSQAWGHSSRYAVCLPLWGWSQAVTLLAYVNHPGSQKDVSYWQPAHSLVEDASVGLRLQQSLPSSSGCCTPASLSLGRRALNGSLLALLWYSSGAILCLWVPGSPCVKAFFRVSL